MKLKGKITISKSTNQDGDKWMHIDVEDNGSHLRLVEVKMSLENFADALTGHGFVDCELETPDDFSNVGKWMQVKTENIDYKSRGMLEPPIVTGKYEDWFAELVQPIEVDGWKADLEKGINWHRAGKGTYSVTFRRWV